MSDQKGKSLTITRVFDAPVSLVWKMWTEPEYFKRWWGPKDFTAPACEIDLKVGGKYVNAMRGPDGKDFWSTGTYKEIVPNQKLVYTDSFADENGNPVSSEHYGMSGFPMETLVTVTFEEQNGKTAMTLMHGPIDTLDTKMLSDMETGWKQSFDKMAERLKKGVK